MTESEKVLDRLWARRDGVLHRIELSALYHQKRERFFDMADKIAKAIAIIGGSAALARLSDDRWLPLIAATVTLTSTLSLVIGFSEKARRHAGLANRYSLLASALVRKGEHDFEEDDLDGWAAEIRKIEAAEPATLGALVEICDAQLRIARGQPHEFPPWWQRLLAHFWDFQKRA